MHKNGIDFAAMALHTVAATWLRLARESASGCLARRDAKPNESSWTTSGRKVVEDAARLSAAKELLQLGANARPLP
jgi:hypothetical protein